MNPDTVLEAYHKTLIRIAGDYPNATKEYKRSSFVIGASELAMMLVDSLPVSEKIAFARKLDKIKAEVFPE